MHLRSIEFNLVYVLFLGRHLMLDVNLLDFFCSPCELISSTKTKGTVLVFLGLSEKLSFRIVIFDILRRLYRLNVCCYFEVYVDLSNKRIINSFISFF